MTRKYHFDRSLGMLSGQISKDIGIVLQKHLNKNAYDLDPLRWSILSFLKNKPNRTQQEIVDYLAIDKVRLKRALDNLESQNILKRSIYNKDKRYNVVNLTDKGLELYKNALPHAKTAISKAFEGFTEEEENKIIDMLIKVKENLKDEINSLDKNR